MPVSNREPSNPRDTFRHPLLEPACPPPDYDPYVKNAWIYVDKDLWRDMTASVAKEVMVNTDSELPGEDLTGPHS